MKNYLLSLLVLLGVLLTGCRNGVIKQHIIVKSIEVVDDNYVYNGQPEGLKYKITFKCSTGLYGIESVFYTNTKYQIGDTLK